MTARITRIRETLAEARKDMDRIALRLEPVDLVPALALSARYTAAHSLHSAIEDAQSRLAVMRELAATEVEARGKAMDKARQVSVRLDTGVVFDQRDPGDETPEIETSLRPPVHPTWAEEYAR